MVRKQSIAGSRVEGCSAFCDGQRVMLDKDLAQLYGVETKVLNQAVKRNRERFPADFMMQLSVKEVANWVTICDLKLGRKALSPFAFTEQGVSCCRASSRASVRQVNIEIMRTFVR